jgi:hypothetical protein
MITKIRIWKPLNNINGNYWFENLSLINGNFVFIYEKDQQINTKIHIVCGGGLPSFRYTNETYINGFTHIDSLEEIKKIRPWCFYTVEDSEYLKKISTDSGGLSDYLGFTHYCIISGDEVLELVYSAEPIVEIVVDGKVIESSDPGHHSLD